MHRSGTSCLAGTLERAGVFLGEVARQNLYNAKGNRESDAIRAVNGLVLRDNGGDWNRPPTTTPVIWRDERRTMRDAIVQSYNGQPVWGFKDPRVLLTLDGWLEALPHLEFVGVVRHPLAVARSLRDRPNGPPLAQGIRLWRIYNQRLLARWRQASFPIVSFDANTEDLEASLLKVTEILNLVPADRRADPFFDPALKHQTKPGTVDADAVLLDDETMRLYEELTALTMQPQRPANSLPVVV